MRKLKLQMQQSLDGFVAGIGDDLSWMIPDWDAGLISFVSALTEPIDLILLGRRLSEGFLPHWAKVASDPEDPSYLAGRKFHDTEKVVFSRSLDHPDGNNTRILQDAGQETIQLLK